MGDFSLNDGIGLAPMDGISDFPMRLWLSLSSQPTFQVTPFLRITATYPSQLPLLWAPELTSEGLSQQLPYDLVPQFMASDPKRLVTVVKSLLPQAPFIELNCGCPAPVVVGKGAGSSLLQDPKTFESFVNYCAAQLGPERLAVKIRSGFTSTLAFPQLIHALAPLRLRRLTVHGRTRIERYRGYANWDLIQYAAAFLEISVHGSGDVTSYSQLHARLGCGLGGVIVGRGALRNPWIFEELRTQQPLQLDAQALLTALYCFALLVAAASSEPHALLALCFTGAFKRKILTCSQAWQALAAKLEALFPQPQLALNSRKTLGRLKLLWNYLRSSMPPAIFALPLLRCTSIASFLLQLEAGLSRHQEHPMAISWQPAYDWLYAGERKPP